MKRPTQPAADSPEDQDLFRNAVGKVRPIAHEPVVVQQRRPDPVPRKTWEDEHNAVLEALWDSDHPEDEETGEELLFLRPGVQRRQLIRLRRGEYAIQGQLDLHGHTVPQAREALAHFLKICQRNGLRCVRIVHGKGNGSLHRLPVLKHKVARWLLQWDAVLAYCSARPRDGGGGAVYVLLKGC